MARTLVHGRTFDNDMVKSQLWERPPRTFKDDNVSQIWSRFASHVTEHTKYVTSILELVL